MNKKEESIHIRCRKEEKELITAKAQMLNFNLSNFIIYSTKEYRPINPMKLNYQHKISITPSTVKTIAETARFLEELDNKYLLTEEDSDELNRRFIQLCQL